MNTRIHHLHQPLPSFTGKQSTKNKSVSFQEVMETTKQLNVSKHARQRLEDRNIHISDSKWQQISSKMADARSKGVTDSLVVMNDATLVVSTKNNTVVTAMSREDANSHIFTNINGTIVMGD